MSDAMPGPGVPEQRGVRDQARGEVLHRHARLTKSGRPIFCMPSRAEIEGHMMPLQSRGTDGEVIYPTREAADGRANGDRPRTQRRQAAEQQQARWPRRG